MRFRIANLEELNKLNQLIKESKGYWGESESFCEEFISKWGLTKQYISQEHLYVLETAGQAIGVLGMSTGDEGPMLDYFFIQPKYIGKGFGRKMWSEAIKICQREGWVKFKFYSNPQSEVIYKHFGAVTIDKFESFPGRFVPVMEKIIPLKERISST